MTLCLSLYLSSLSRKGYCSGSCRYRSRGIRYTRACREDRNHIRCDIECGECRGYSRDEICVTIGGLAECSSIHIIHSDEA